MTTQTDLPLDALDPVPGASAAKERDRLYRLWEEGNWSATALDFSQDARDWTERLSGLERRSILWNYSMFLDGEESVTLTLTPFVKAAWRYEDRIFLATQIADEARHHVFFDRFMREVAGIGTDLASTLGATRPSLTWGYRQVFGELDRVADELRRHPRERALLAQGVALYHLVIESMLAHTGQHYLGEYVTAQGIFPGFATGIAAVARDESRHIAFGVGLLRLMVTDSRELKEAAIAMLNRVLPWASGVFTPPDLDWSLLTGLGYEPREIFAFGLRSLQTTLARAGIAAEEVLELAKLDAAAPPAAQAARLMTFVQGGVVGTPHPPRVTEEVLDALFAATRDAAVWSARRRRAQGARALLGMPMPTARTPRAAGTVQWLFDDAAPRYLELDAPGGPRVGVGAAPRPRLTLRCAAADWARIAGGRLTHQQALLSRRLRVSGDWGLALRLPHILPPSPHYRVRAD